jgi:NAD(P)-dependent dehydrogenase (short-subunit alcohol dehydrogenase family)
MTGSRFRNQVVVVTGGGSGLGAAVACGVSAEGGHVVVVDRNGAAARAVVDTFRTSGLAIEADIADTNAAKEIVGQAVEHFGALHGFHANAGIAGPLANITDVGPEAFDEVMRINVAGNFRCVQAALRYMLESGTHGAVLITASVLGLIGAQGAAAYAMSKHALVGLTRCAALESGSSQIRVNALCPGYIDTPLMRATESVVGGGDTERGRQIIESSTSLRRYARVGEVSSLALWLLSDEASYVNGACFSVDAAMAAGVSVTAQ